MKPLAALRVDDEDFSGHGREFLDLNERAMAVALSAHIVLYRGRVLKNRAGPVGEIRAREGRAG